MNKKDRKQVGALLERLQELRSECEEIGEELRGMVDSEKEKFDNMPEGLQSSENGQKIGELAEILENAAGAALEGDLAEAIDQLGQME